MESEPQASGADLAPGRPEGAGKTTEAEPAVAQRWLVCAPSRRASEPRLVYDFVMDRTHDGRAIRMLTIVDEYTREALAIDVGRRLNSQDVLYRLAELFVHRGSPESVSYTHLTLPTILLV